MSILRKLDKKITAAFIRAKNILSDNSGFELVQLLIVLVIAAVLGLILLDSMKITFNEVLTMAKDKILAPFAT